MIFDEIATTALNNRRKLKEPIRKSNSFADTENDAARREESKRVVIERISSLFVLNKEDSQGVDLVYTLKASSSLHLVITPLFVSVRLFCSEDTYEIKKILLHTMARLEFKNLLHYLLTKAEE